MAALSPDLSSFGSVDDIDLEPKDSDPESDPSDSDWYSDPRDSDWEPDDASMKDKKKKKKTDRKKRVLLKKKTLKTTPVEVGSESELETKLESEFKMELEFEAGRGSDTENGVSGSADQDGEKLLFGQIKQSNRNEKLLQKSQDEPIAMLKFAEKTYEDLLQLFHQRKAAVNKAVKVVEEARKKVGELRQKLYGLKDSSNSSEPMLSPEKSSNLTLKIPLTPDLKACLQKTQSHQSAPSKMETKELQCSEYSMPLSLAKKAALQKILKISSAISDNHKAQAILWQKKKESEIIQIKDLKEKLAGLSAELIKLQEEYFMLEKEHLELQAEYAVASQLPEAMSDDVFDKNEGDNQSQTFLALFEGGLSKPNQSPNHSNSNMGLGTPNLNHKQQFDFSLRGKF